MQAHEIEHPIASPRIKRLVEAASEKCEGQIALAERMGVSKQLITNWKNGSKVPSPEAQTELAWIAGPPYNAVITPLLAMIEKATGDRKEMLQTIYREWSKKQGIAPIPPGQDWRKDTAPENVGLKHATMPKTHKDRRVRKL